MNDLVTSFADGAVELLSFFITVALLQNIVLTTAFGSSMMLSLVRKPKSIWLFTGILTVFSVLTVVIAYPLDALLGTGVDNYWRPLMMTGITVVLYCVACLLLIRCIPAFYKRVASMLPMAAFNNLVLGIALVCNVQFTSSLGGVIGLAVGSCLGFGLLAFVTAEGIERLDNPDMPAAFRGMPATLVYLGLLALALLGFTSDFSLI